MKLLDKNFLIYENIVGNIDIKWYNVTILKPGRIQPFYHISYRLIFIR